MPEPAPGERPTTGLGRVVMVIPTYNEADNLAWIVGRLRAAQPEVDVLVVDDNSPDGTGDDRRRAGGRRRPGARSCTAPRRPASARRTSTASRWRSERGYDVIGEMDADGSHQPEQLHRLLEALRDADLVIGSRWVPGGSVVNWPRSRELLSRGGNLYVRTAARHARARRHGRLPALPAHHARDDRPRIGAARRATSSRPTWPTASSARGCACARCRSSSSSGCAATPR